MKPYKKRLKGNWRQGKRYKGDSEERQFAKSEIKQQLAEEDEKYLDKHHKGARTKNVKARLEHQVKLYEQVLERPRHASDWLSNYFRDALKKARKKLNEFLKEEK